MNYSCKQARIRSLPLTWLGSCYGYSHVQAHGGDKEVRNPKEIILPLTQQVYDAQLGQIVPGYNERHYRIFLFNSGLNTLIDQWDKEWKNGGKTIINCYAMIGAHAVVLAKKADGKFEFLIAIVVNTRYLIKKTLRDGLPFILIITMQIIFMDLVLISLKQKRCLLYQTY